MSGPIDNNGNIHGSDGRFVSLEAYMDRVFEERDARYKERWEAQQREVALAQREMERRLEGLNELRKQAIEDRGRFVTRELFDTELEQLKTFRNRATGAAVVLALLAGVVGAAIARAFS